MTFGQDGGTIGRSLQNDWPLPDKQKYLSARHACIDFRSGSYYIVDTSKNGVYITGENEPVGRGKPQRLFEGDLIRIGEYEMRTAIESVDDTRDSLIASSHIDPVDLKQLVDAPDPTSYDLVDVHAMTGVKLEIALEEEIGEQAQQISGQTSKPVAVSKANTATLHQTVRGASPLDAFFRGAGIEAPRIEGPAAEKMFEQIGKVSRALVAGLVDNMQLRAVQKAQMRQTSTTSGAGDDQIAFSNSVQDSLERLFAVGKTASANPANSVRAAFDDLRTHQRALLAGNRHALNEYLKRMDPDTIEGSVAGGKRGSFLNAANRFRFWSIYRDVYAILANRAGDEWPEPYQIALGEFYAKTTNPVAEDSEPVEQQRAAG
jgi:predicted component of type VI protein secretion system